jgi:hypothetical protein
MYIPALFSFIYPPAFFVRSSWICIRLRLALLPTEGFPLDAWIHVSPGLRVQALRQPEVIDDFAWIEVDFLDL